MPERKIVRHVIEGGENYEYLKGQVKGRKQFNKNTEKFYPIDKKSASTSYKEGVGDVKIPKRKTSG